MQDRKMIPRKTLARAGRRVALAARARLAHRLGLRANGIVGADDLLQAARCPWVQGQDQMKDALLARIASLTSFEAIAVTDCAMQNLQVPVINRP